MWQQSRYLGFSKLKIVLVQFSHMFHVEDFKNSETRSEMLPEQNFN